ncbi:MAG: transcriptional regulator [Hydrocarboniphaga sp.]|uniref:addiction module antidote protein n=1 Tax=Hydrocarboniphaga sp. TaxID=2033016 RepID=UPI0026119E75|nr:addiction module antidote protein [Hydrocarboniphaga sp.]MDB5972419.1 transcriptional regulator [Hydrocarboniphaga sp.]
MRTHTGKRAAVSESPSRPYHAASYLRSDEDRAAYLEALLEDGDARVLTLGLRDLAESVGGMSALASKAGLSRETLYRTLSDAGNPRLDTLAAILKVFGLRLSVLPVDRQAA